MAAIRPDLVFSYWIYAWFVLYIFHFTTYSPKFPLILGLIDNIIMLILMLYFGSKSKTIILFIIINTLIKVVPLYYLRNQKIHIKDICFTVGLFVIFVIWLHINKQSLVGNLKLIHDSLLYNKFQTPFMSLFNKIEINFKKLEIF
jgi:hypothetical protein